MASRTPITTGAVPQVFDRGLIARHLGRRPGNASDFVTALAIEDLGQRLRTVTRRFESALILGPDPKVLPVEGETAEGSFPFLRAGTVTGTSEALLVDPEYPVLPAGPHDLVVSLLDLQAVNDVPGFLHSVRRQMRPDGLFLAAFLGGATLSELRQAFVRADAELSGGAFARVAPFVDVGDAGALLQRAGFALPVVDLETHQVRYPHAFALMQELHALGASNPLLDRPTRFATRTLLGAAARHYGEIAGDPDGRVRATLEIVWLSGWVPHESQRQPLAPGSAQVSLKDVLGRKS